MPKDYIKTFYTYLTCFGFDPLKTARSLWALPHFWADFWRLHKQMMQQPVALRIPFGTIYPCLSDRGADSGSASGHYFHQDLLVAQRVFLNNPAKHVDIGSRVDGFVAHVASFREIEVLDVRPLNLAIKNIFFKQIDLMNQLDPRFYEYADSISCLHAIEHFGLGRYGESVNYLGHLDGLANISKMLKKGGTLYISMPIGPSRIEFNAHRVFSVTTLLNQVLNHYQVVSFSFVDDNGDLHENVDLCDDSIVSNFGCTYGCGIFELKKVNEAIS